MNIAEKRIKPENHNDFVWISKEKKIKKKKPFS